MLRPSFLLSYLFILVVGLTSCVKQPGCIDPNAANYEFEAEADDGTCKYDLHFWLNTVSYGSVDIYVDDQLRGTLNCAITGPPRCGVDDFSVGQVRCNLLVALDVGYHDVEARSFDGSIFKETYYLGENCLSVLITDHK